MRRDLARDDAVTAVIGTILVVGILVASIATVRMVYVPVWEEDAEAAHMAVVERQLQTLKSEIDRLTGNRSAAAVANPISLADDRASPFKGSLSGLLEFNATNAPATLSANKILILQLDQTSMLGINETFQDIPSSQTVSEMSRVLSLRLKIDQVSNALDGKSINITITNAQGAYAGDLNVSVVRLQGSDYDVHVRVRNSTNTVLYDQGAPYQVSATIAPYWLNVLNQDYRFDRVLAAATPPYNITINERGLTGNYSISYAQSTPAGEVIVGGAGLEHTNYTQTYTGGVLAYRSGNAFYENQRYLLSNGAMVLEQGDGAVMKVVPGLTANPAGSLTSINLDLPVLTGTATSMSAQGTATVYTRTRSLTTTIAQASSLVLNVTTPYPALWTSAWSSALNASGLSSASGHFTTATGSTWARVSIYGLTSDPASTAYDLFLTLRQANIEINLR